MAGKEEHRPGVIEITDEMVAAGVEVLETSGAGDLTLEPAEKVAKYAAEVFEAMARRGGYRVSLSRLIQRTRS